MGRSRFHERWTRIQATVPKKNAPPEDPLAKPKVEMSEAKDDATPRTDESDEKLEGERPV